MSGVAQRPPLEVLRSQLGVQLRAIEGAEPGVRSGAGPDALHDFRVALRRSRALIRASRPLLRDRLALLDRELRWLGGATGPLRDSDVLIAHLAELRRGLRPDRAGTDALIAALRLERDAQRTALLRAIASTRYRGLIARFRTALETLGVPDDPEAHFDAGRAAAKEFARLHDAYLALAPDPADAALHAVRIKAKHARYAAEFAARAEGGGFARLAKTLAALQDAIGSHQDAVVAVARLRPLADQQTAIAVGRIIEIELERRRAARARVPQLWARIERAAAGAFA